MRLHVLLLVTLGLIATEKANSQPDTPLRKRYFDGVITVGINGSQIDGDGLTGFNMPGLYAGVGARYVVSPQWAFGPEFLYSDKGARTTLDDEAKGVTRLRTRMRFIDFPLLAYYTPAAASEFTFVGGLAFSYLLKAKLENGNNFAVVTDRWTRNDYGAVGGFEYRFTDRVSATARWTYSILPTNANYDFTDPQFSGIALRGFGTRNNTISVALRIHLNTTHE